MCLQEDTAALGYRWFLRKNTSTPPGRKRRGTCARSESQLKTDCSSSIREGWVFVFEMGSNGMDAKKKCGFANCYEHISAYISKTVQGRRQKKTHFFHSLAI